VRSGHAVRRTTGDLLRIFLQVTGGGPTDIYLATRATTAVEFATPTLVPGVGSGNGAAIDTAPVRAADSRLRAQPTRPHFSAAPPRW